MEGEAPSVGGEVGLAMNSWSFASVSIFPFADMPPVTEDVGEDEVGPDVTAAPGPLETRPPLPSLPPQVALPPAATGASSSCGCCVGSCTAGEECCRARGVPFWNGAKLVSRVMSAKRSFGGTVRGRLRGCLLPGSTSDSELAANEVCGIGVIDFFIVPVAAEGQKSLSADGEWSRVRLTCDCVKAIERPEVSERFAALFTRTNWL